MSDHPSIPLEIAVFSGSSILKAQSLGASRVELNAPGSYKLGGTTPPLQELSSVAKHIAIPVRIMIRPRGPPSPPSPDFIYTNEEFEIMRRSIQEFKTAGLMDHIRGDGFVFGVLQLHGESLLIDGSRCEDLVNLAEPFRCVFHRAFDSLPTLDNANLLIDLGFNGILTAGGPGNCLDNVNAIGDLCRGVKGQIEIIAGGGLRKHNIPAPARHLSVSRSAGVWMHTAAMSKRQAHPVEDIDEDELFGMAIQLRTIAGQYRHDLE